MADDRKSSFWTSLGGILTGLAGVISAAAAVAALVISSGGDGGDSASKESAAASGAPASEEVTLNEWAEQANRICGEAYDEIRALGIAPDANSQFAAIPQTTQISAEANAKLGALDRPPEAEEQIRELIEQASRLETAANNAYNAYTNSDLTTAQSEWQTVTSAQREVQRINAELGANVCARGP